MMHMATNKALGVNAAFLQEIKEDHVELTELMGKLDRAFDQDVPRRKPRELVYLLFMLRDRIAIHFSLEETLGYCEGALEVAPWLSAEASNLRSEHAALCADTCRMTHLAETLLAPSDDADQDLAVTFLDLARSYARFREMLKLHEQKEMELIMAAYSTDVGVGD